MDFDPVSLNHLVISNRITEISEATAFFNKMTAFIQLHPDMRRQWLVIIDEILANIIQHGFPEGGDHNITMALQISDVDILISFSDHGQPFDPVNFVSPAPGDLYLEMDGGSGLRLVKAFADSLDYHYHQGQNVLALRKYYKHLNR